MEAFDTWAAQAQLPNTQLLKDIGHPDEPPFIGVDATYFLEQTYLLRGEPLAAALGGFPFTFESKIIKAIDTIEATGCKLHFVFNGLQTNFDEPSFDNSIHENIARAFKCYEEKDKERTERTLELFRAAGFPDINWLCVALKITLGKHAKPFTVAPFKAHAQLVYALQQGAVDALYGSTELFLYGAPKVITKIRIPPESADEDDNDKAGSEQEVESLKIVWLELEQCLKMLGDVSFELFQNAMLLVGTKCLEAFPPLKDSHDSQTALPFKEVVATLSQMNGNIFHFCERYPPGVRGDWLDRYMRAHQAIKHMIIMFDYETVKPRTYLVEEEVGRIPVDIHELVGLQLPAELHHYLYHGMIGTRVLNWLVSGKIKLSAPLTGGENEIYRKLVREQLDSWRKQALSLIAFTLSRYYQRKEFVTQIWYSADLDQKFSMGDLTSEKQTISGWRVKDVDMENQLKVIKTKAKHVTIGSLQFALAAVADASFVPKTISSARRSSSENQLQSLEEITCNVLWRLLQIRGYINKQHELTGWGKFLLSAIEKVGDSVDQAESIFLVVELMRLDLLDKAQALHKDPEYAPNFGLTPERDNCLFVSPIACTGKLIHAEEGYIGPLNAHHLAYHCMITEIRLALRDLIDMILATMFLDDEVERIRDDHLKIAAALPFREHWSVGLGILSTFFHNELIASIPEKCRDDEREGNNNKPEGIIDLVAGYMSYANVKDSMQVSGRLWDAFISALKSAPADIVSTERRETWLKTDKWYLDLRARGNV